MLKKVPALLLVCALPLQAEEAKEADTAKPVDPLESINRKVFVFNDGLDRFLLKPAAKSYRFVTPDPVEDGISNFFSNVGEVGNVANDVLQGKGKQAGKDSARFVINLVLGLGGLVDVASDMGIKKSDGEDFSQTLATWGVPRGPYLVVPFLGPSTVRDAGSRVVDSFTSPVRYIDDVSARNTLVGLDLLDTRASLLDAEELLKGDKYLLIRDIYLQRRDYLESDGAVEDDFGDFEDY